MIIHNKILILHFEQFHFRSTCKTYKNVTFTRRYPGLCDLLTKHSTDTCLKEKLPSPITFSDHQILDITKIVNDDKLEKPNTLNDDMVDNLKIEAGFMNDDPFTRAQKIEAQSRVNNKSNK